MSNLYRDKDQPSTARLTKDREVERDNLRPFEEPHAERPSEADASASPQVNLATPFKNIEHLQEKVFAQTLLTVGAGKSSAALDSFACWFLVGFAAILTFLLGHLDTVGKYLSIYTIRRAAYIFIGAIAVVVAEKAISVVVVGSAEASAIGREVGKATAEQGINLDLPAALHECERAILFPMKKLVRRSLAKLEAGDLAAFARGLTKASQVQSILVLIEVGLITWAAMVLIEGLVI